MKYRNTVPYGLLTVVAVTLTIYMLSNRTTESGLDQVSASAHQVSVRYAQALPEVERYLYSYCNVSTSQISLNVSDSEQAPCDCAIGEIHKDLPIHVAKVIAKLYHKLKTHNCIINDLRTTYQPIIPAIYHFIRFNQSVVKFHEMLSIKSVLKNGKPEVVYIHANQQLEGRFWDSIKDDSRVKVIHRPAPTSIFGKAIGPIQHASDLARIQVLREYGGIYLDNDCIVLNEFERLRRHHCVVSKSSQERHMGNMIMMASKDCVFFLLYEELYRLNYQKHRWYYNGGELPQYAILDQYPGIAFMADEGVQEDIKTWLYKSDRPVIDYQKYWSIIHLFYRHRYHQIDYDDKIIRTKNDSFSRIARWLLYGQENILTT